MSNHKKHRLPLPIGFVILLISIVLFANSASVQAQNEPNCDLSSADAFFERATERSDSDNYQGAIDDLTCALSLDPDNVAFYNNRGIAYDDIGEYDRALEDYERVLELDPKYPYVYNNRGNIYYMWGDYDTALADYTRSIELHVGPATIPYFNRGNVHQMQGEYDLALADFDMAIELDPQYEKSYLSRAWTYLMMNDERTHGDFARWLELIETREVEYLLEGALDDETFEMAEGRVFSFTFDAVSGQEVSAFTATDEGQEVDPLLVILDEDGTAIMSDDDSGVNLDATISGFVILSDGTYTLLLGHAGGGSDGIIHLTMDFVGKGVADSATYYLYINDIAEVYTSGDTLNLRTGPGLDFEILDRLERGELVTMLEGPHKSDGYAWWRVLSNEDVIGWAVERADNEQTLQLALLVGEMAIVTSGEDVLNVRSQPNTEAEILFHLEDGQMVTLLDMPQFFEGYRWWRIRTTDDREGWAVDRVEGERVMIPARERR